MGRALWAPPPPMTRSCVVHARPCVVHARPCVVHASAHNWRAVSLWLQCLCPSQKITFHSFSPHQHLFFKGLKGEVCYNDHWKYRIWFSNLYNKDMIKDETGATSLRKHAKNMKEMDGCARPKPWGALGFLLWTELRHWMSGNKDAVNALSGSTANCGPRSGCHYC